ncbi:MAG: hypothetical protein K9L70_04750 [Thiohalocapsa sp.]|jgi:hypothetical protein|nr:hypothetical protein [Thiohalocapsa sp.]MCF7989127.1 hypothetical protein [Thiohalocapsa sp.]
MNAVRLTNAMELLRPIGIIGAFWAAFWLGETPAAVFTLLAPILVVVLNGSIAFEGLFLSEAASAKIGYAGDRQYQRQSALANLAVAIVAVLAAAAHWGVQAHAAVLLVCLLFLALSAANHVYAAVHARNFKPANLARPALTLALWIAVTPLMLQALATQ